MWILSLTEMPWGQSYNWQQDYVVYSLIEQTLARAGERSQLKKKYSYFQCLYVWLDDLVYSNQLS